MDPNVDPPDDNPLLLARLKAGEDAAFDELVQLAGGRMLAAARRLLPREEDAQDAVQDAFLSAFKSIHTFDGRAKLTTWLHRITVNAALMKLRTQRRRAERSIDSLLPEFNTSGHQINTPNRWNPAGLAGIERKELRDLLRSKIDEIPEPYREVLLLRDIEDLDTQQTAELLGLTTAAVKTRLHRARQALRSLLDPHFAE